MGASDAHILGSSSHKTPATPISAITARPFSRYWNFSLELRLPPEKIEGQWLGTYPARFSEIEISSIIFNELRWILGYPLALILKGLGTLSTTNGSRSTLNKTNG